MTKLSDVIHFYIGCEAEIYNADIKPQYIPISGFIIDTQNEYIIKPILRRLSSMTEEEALEAIKIKFGQSHNYSNLSYDKVKEIWLADFDNSKRVGIRLAFVSPNLFVHLLSKHFDLFGLIDSQQAIEKKH